MGNGQGMNSAQAACGKNASSVKISKSKSRVWNRVGTLASFMHKLEGRDCPATSKSDHFDRRPFMVIACETVRGCIVGECLLGVGVSFPIMIRPCFIVADRNFSGNISTRKLVIETAKLNVITTYSGSETVETLKKFPKVDGIVMDCTVDDIPVDDLIAQLKRLQPKIPVILIRSPGRAHSELADYQIESFQPGPLLELLQSLRPEKTKAIEKEDERLADEDQ